MQRELPQGCKLFDDRFVSRAAVMACEEFDENASDTVGDYSPVTPPGPLSRFRFSLWLPPYPALPLRERPAIWRCSWTLLFLCPLHPAAPGRASRGGHARAALGWTGGVLWINPACSVVANAGVASAGYWLHMDLAPVFTTGGGYRGAGYSRNSNANGDVAYWLLQRRQIACSRAATGAAGDLLEPVG